MPVIVIHSIKTTPDSGNNAFNTGKVKYFTLHVSLPFYNIIYFEPIGQNGILDAIFDRRVYCLDYIV